MTTATDRVRQRAAQQPPWESDDVLRGVRQDLARLPPLTDAAACRRLLHDLARAARGSAFVLQGGDCAEPFADSAPDRISAKAAHLAALADRLETRAGLPVVRVGRFAGQYAKPRSQDVETSDDGVVLPVYRGDAVNRPEAAPAARRPDPLRLRSAYDHAAACLDTLLVGGHLVEGHLVEGRLVEGHPAHGPADRAPSPVYTSHEALLVDYEEPLVRPDRTDPHTGGRYGSSAHMLWIGERTRRPDGWHVRFAETVNNPVGVKLGPGATPQDVRELCERLADGRPAGRLSLITRLGAADTARLLPPLVDAAAAFSGRVVWLCDPMHGNTVRHGSGRKTRVLADVEREVRDFFAVLRAHGAHPGGLHLEMTPDDVTECVDRPADLTAGALPRYLTACDPRLGPGQADRLITVTAGLLERKDVL
ncbi:3-deoxy-7-phosphoheptulonate synthase [Streptomyces sp. NPDC089915]|uniref:3-deoxy-7-phosphoheptulonate synthase n=1 Tax=Streptomyces sp. NPDC089915 TaxID=3155186 RepID=UPI003428784C